ncbi:MAG: hypothetical protein WKF30_08430 [Pyrinomonadaceae bacterium]
MHKLFTAEQGALNYFNYFTEIEDTFVRRRGKHLLLSPADWALIESWKTKGVPLHIVLRGIEQAFDSYDAKPRRRSVKSLFYCQEEVEAQFAEWTDSRLGASSAEANAQPAEPHTASAALPFPRETIAAHFVSVRQALEAARAGRAQIAADDLYQALGRAAIRVEELRLDFEQTPRPDMQGVENSLTHLEELLDRSLHTSLSAAEVAQSKATAELQLKPYKDRMASEAYVQTLNNLMAKRLRERAGVPRLSLFYI